MLSSYLFIYWLCHSGWGILVPWLGIEPRPPAVEARSLITGLPGMSGFLIFKCLYFKWLCKYIHNILIFAPWPPKPKKKRKKKKFTIWSFKKKFANPWSKSMPFDILVLQSQILTNGFCSKLSVVTLGINFLRYPKQWSSLTGHKGRTRTHNTPEMLCSSESNIRLPRTLAPGVWHLVQCPATSLGDSLLGTVPSQQDIFSQF